MLEPEILDRLRASPRLATSITPGTSVAYLAFNFRDRRLADRRRVTRDRRGDRSRPAGPRARSARPARPATGLLTPEHWAYADVPRSPPVAASGAAGSSTAPASSTPTAPGRLPRFRIVYKTSNQPGRRRLAEALQAELAGVGIALDVRTYEWGTLFADIRSGNFELASMTWVGVADPTSIASPITRR